MTESRPSLDPQRQALARVYSRLRRRAALAESGLGLAYLVAVVATGASARIASLVPGSADRSWPLDLILTATCLAVPWFVISLPFDYYTGFHLPHRFGQSSQSRADWCFDVVKGLLVGAAIGLPILIGLYAVMRTWPEAWWAIAGVGYLGFAAILAILAPIVLLPLFNRFRPLGDEHAALADRLVQLSAAAGRRVRGVYTFDLSRRTKSANAALVGMGGTRRIILGDTLLGEFPPDEVEAVMAHELGHHVHGDIPAGVVAGTGMMVVGLWTADAVLAAAVAGGALQASSDPAGLPLLALVLAVVGFLAAPFENAYSRRRERRADSFSLSLTRRPQAFADAMTRLANQNLADANPPRWAVILFGTHPPLAERIRLAEAHGTTRP